MKTQQLAAQNNYSLGFQRYILLSRKKKLNAFKAIYLEGITDIPTNNDLFISRLAAMSETEYKSFKSAK